MRFLLTLQSYHANFSLPSKVRASRCLGRCHAALGQPALSASVFDAALGLARDGAHLLSESLVVKARAQAGGVGWTEQTSEQRLREVMGRMGGERAPLERLLLGE